MTAGSLRAVFLLSGLALTTLGLALGCKDPVPKPSAAKSAKADATASAPSAYGLARYPKTPSAPAPVALPVGKGASVKQERYIVVDQFGYTPAMPKRAILVDPVSGWNGNDEYHPPKRMQVRHWNDSRVAFEGRTSVWNGGKVDPSAGDRGAWFDFSMLKKNGLYYVFDPKSSTRSDPFRIARNVYAEVLRAAVRMYYFNRANFEKKPPHSCVKQRCWSIGVDGLEPGQDGSARSVSDRENPATARDLRGGWWDAGDTNKYVTFAKDAVQQLLTAYDENPDVFGDDFGIPESGNSKPDLLDEVRIELEWLRRMQPRDLAGGVLLKVGAVELDNDLPDKSKTHRYYYPKPCSSATIAAAGMFAHAALVYGAFASDEAFAKDLRERAIRAWDAYQKQPRSETPSPPPCTFSP